MHVKPVLSAHFGISIHVNVASYVIIPPSHVQLSKSHTHTHAHIGTERDMYIYNIYHASFAKDIHNIYKIIIKMCVFNGII